MTAQTYAPARAGHLANLITIGADITEGLPTTVFHGLPDRCLREARDRIRAAIINSGEHWPSAVITVSPAPARNLGRTSNLDLAIGVAILAAAEDVPHVQLSFGCASAEGCDHHAHVAVAHSVTHTPVAKTPADGAHARRSHGFVRTSYLLQAAERSD